MEAREFDTVRDLALSVNLAERHVSRQLRLAYLASEALKRLIFGRDTMPVNVVPVTDTEIGRGAIGSNSCLKNTVRQIER